MEFLNYSCGALAAKTVDTRMLQLATLYDCLLSIAPVELKGMGLLRAQPHLLVGTVPIPRSQLVEAVTEIVAYTGRCTAAARQLAQITPIPIRAVGIVEYVL